MQDLYKIRRLFSISPYILASKISEIPFNKIKKRQLNSHIAYNCTFSKKNLSDVQLVSVFKLPFAEAFARAIPQIENAMNNILSHKFDLLGSGSVKVSHTGDYPGFLSIDKSQVIGKYDSKLQYKSKLEYIDNNINKKNRDYARELISLLPEEYELIDWQRDFISGYRWSELKPTHNLSYGSDAGSDVKVPWELGRLQHITLFPIAYKLASEGKLSIDSTRLLNEYKHQVLDFIASNPRHFGIQWKCTMDVSIRMLSLAVSFQLFEDAGVQFDSNFRNILLNAIQSHIVHSVENLEWAGGMRGNHYLASICSLVITCIMMQSIRENLDYLSMAVSELFKEILHQFNRDGSNFEGSMSYHYFAFEMITYALLALNTLPEKHLANLFAQANNKHLTVSNWKAKISKKIQDRLNNIITFSYANIINNSTWNIGDNDSGKFLKLCPRYHYSTNENYDISHNYNIYSDLLQSISFLVTTPQKELPIACFFARNNQNIVPKLLKTNNHFRDFGLYLFTKTNYTAAFRCGKIGQFGKGGHTHNDQLSLLLKVNGEDVLIDNGTYTYTASPAIRNKFRSTEMHNTLAIANMEQNDWRTNSHDDLFWLANNKGTGKILSINENSISAQHKAYGKPCIRTIIFEEDRIIIEDSLDISQEKNINFYLPKNIIIKNNNNEITNSSLCAVRGSKTIKVDFRCSDRIVVINDYSSYAYGKRDETSLAKITTKEKNIKCEIMIDSNE